MADDTKATPAPSKSKTPIADMIVSTMGLKGEDDKNWATNAEATFRMAPDLTAQQLHRSRHLDLVQRKVVTKAGDHPHGGSWDYDMKQDVKDLFQQVVDKAGAILAAEKVDAEKAK